MLDKGQISPGVRIRERDLTPTPVPAINNTVAGLVGETLKGPAFELIRVDNYDQFVSRFGGTNPEIYATTAMPRYELPYIAKQYLTEGQNLFVVKVLGKSGYIDSAGAWVLQAKMGPNTGITGSAVEVVPQSNVILTGGTPQGLLLSGYSDSVFVPTSGATIENGENWTLTGFSYTLISDNNYASSSVTASFPAKKMAIGVLRSTGTYVNDVLNQPITGVSASSNAITEPLNVFTLSAFTSAQTFTYQVSLDVTSRNYIGSVISTDPKDKKSQIWLEEIFPQSFRKAVENGEVFGILPTLYFNNNIGNFAQEFKTPLSPWLVSDLKGNRVFRLFRFIAISDGKAANREIKISISNINLDTREFDVEVRDYNDTDNRVSILEQFTRCSLDPRSNNYIAQKIGDGVRYNIQSRYIFLEMAENAPIDGVAAGFEGYTAKLYGAAQTVSNIANNLTIDPPKMYYNLAYDTRNDRVNRVYLGVSERGFDATGYRASTLDGSRFDFSDDTFEGIPVTTGMTKGFHMDSGVTETEMSSMFETTPYGFQTEEQVVGTPFERIIARKFTVALAGGFDGWDIYRTSRTNTDQFKAGGLFYRRSSPAFNGTQLANEGSDWYAWKEGIDLLTLSEDTQMELIATPSLNISDHRSLVSETLENVEEQGTALYIINLPDIEPSATYAEEVVDLLDQSDFDTNYAATYAPWVLMSDVENGGSLYVPPTAEVFRTMARTDNVTFPWFAAAGLTRGTLQSNRARMILRENDREILYKGRINPIATFDGSPTIWGQKTLQVRQSPLDRINVRRLLLRAARIVISQTRILLFDPNDNVTVTRFEDILNSIFRNIREQRGVTDFFVKVTAFNTAETRERNELIGEIYLKPTKTAEIIKVGFNITPESFNFAEL